MGPVLASVAVAPLFGFIHFPLLFISGGVTQGKVTPARLGLGILQLIFLNSVPVPVLTVFCPGVDGEWLFGALAVVAIAAIVLTRGRPELSPGGRAAAAVPGPCHLGRPRLEHCFSRRAAQRHDHPGGSCSHQHGRHTLDPIVELEADHREQ